MKMTNITVMIGANYY